MIESPTSMTIPLQQNAPTPSRTASIQRDSRETQIAVSVNLDGRGQASIKTGMAFMDHMLEQIAVHGLIDLDIQATGDLHIDAHHTVEDLGISLGQALAKAWGDKRGLCRYGHAIIPLDEALSRVVMDLSGRPGLHFRVAFAQDSTNGFDFNLVHEFFMGLVNHAGMTLHVDNLYGENAHHQCETIFKAFARSLRMAIARDERASNKVPSSKGML